MPRWLWRCDHCLRMLSEVIRRPSFRAFRWMRGGGHESRGRDGLEGVKTRRRLFFLRKARERPCSSKVCAKSKSSLYGVVSRIFSFFYFFFISPNSRGWIKYTGTLAKECSRRLAPEEKKDIGDGGSCHGTCCSRCQLITETALETRVVKGCRVSGGRRVLWSSQVPGESDVRERRDTVRRGRSWWSGGGPQSQVAPAVLRPGSTGR
ncbi:hypothetical protein LY78DRAFT_327760 [Colletotrichum sublineola]|nr:hypothetical protein LY78DRAFT_327760 [Colletotrichum sublineola]